MRVPAGSAAVSGAGGGAKSPNLTNGARIVRAPVYRMPQPLALAALLLVSFGVGFIAAMPVGAQQVEIAKRAIHGHLAAAVMVGIGSMLSDGMYGAIAIFGLAPFLTDKSVVAICWIIGGALSFVLGVLTVRGVRRNGVAPHDVRDGGKLANVWLSLATGFSLAVTNPYIMLWWLLGVQFLARSGVLRASNTTDASLFLLAGAIGMGSYLSTLAVVLRRLKHFFSARTIARITLACGVILIGVAVLFVARAAMMFAQ